MKSKQLRNALIVSIMSLTLCCAMLIGTTYAWLTDSVTSGSNRIIAGTVDVRLMGWVEDDDGTKEYTDISGQTGDLFLEDEEFVWEPGTKKTVNIAVKNNGNLPVKYEIGLVLKDAGLAELLEYSMAAVDDRNEEMESLSAYNEEDESEGVEDDLEYFSLGDEAEHETYDEETELGSGVSYAIISEERILISPEQENEIAAMEVSDSGDTESEETESKKDSIDHFELTIRMKDIPTKEMAERLRRAQCEIDICVIATQVMDDVEEGGEDTIEIPLPNVEEYIYHFTTVEVEIDEENEVYKTTNAVTASSSNASIGIELPTGIWLEGDVEEDAESKTVILSVKPNDVETEFVEEETRYKRTTNVRLYDVNEDNPVPFTLIQNIGAENLLIEILYGESPEEEFEYTYDQETGEVRIQSIYQGDYTLVWRAMEE